MTSQSRKTFSLYPGVNTRIIGPFLLIVILIAGLGVFIVTNLVAGSIQERFSNQLVDSANSAANTIVDIEREYLATLRLMTFTDGIAESIISADSLDLDTALRPIAANNRIDEVIVFNNSRVPLLYLSRVQNEFEVEFRTPTPPKITDWTGVDRIITGQADELGDRFVDVIYFKDDPVFYFAGPVYNDNNELAGGMLIGIRADTLSRRVSEQALSSITFIAPDGTLMGSTFRRDIEALVRSEENTRALLEAAQSTSPIEQIELGGIPYQVIYITFKLRSQEIGLLSVGLPSNFIVEQSSTSRNVFGALFGMLFVVVAIMGILISRTITNPIRQLVFTTRAIREGDLNQRVRLNLPDELGELGNSFDAMTDTLVQRNTEIQGLFQQQVEQTAQREAMLTSISDVVIVQNSYREILFENHTAKALREKLKELPQDLNTFNELCLNPAALTTPQTVSLADYHYSLLATPVRMNSGDLLGYVIVFRDITAIIESEQLKDELVLQMSHELRTPLAAVRGYVDLVKMLEAANITEQGLGFVESAREHLSVLENLINQVIDVSAMLSNRFTIDLDTIELHQLLYDLVDRWRPIFAQRHHKIKISLSNPEIMIEGDQRRIEELIEHLLRNAYNYTLPGGDINIHAGSINNYAIITVQDNGVGIDRDEVDLVFERMYRGRSADAGPTDARGLGLGLYIAKQIVEAHHGSISLQSEVKVGTVITVTLPVKQPKNEPG